LAQGVRRRRRRGQRIVIDLTSAFFNRFLRWWPSPVPEKLTKRFPEVIDMTGTI
jgi:hypothetical protein